MSNAGRRHVGTAPSASPIAATRCGGSRLGVRWGAVALGIALALALPSGCKKKEETTAQVDGPPRPGGASAEVVDTGLGAGLALDAHLAPTSTRWQRAVVIGEGRVVLLGRAHDHAIALRTDDGGKSWRSMQGPAQGWTGWGTSEDGTVVLATGKRAQGTIAKDGLKPIETAELWFGSPDATKLAGPTVLLPAKGELEKATISAGYAIPAVLSPELAALVVDKAARQPVIVYGVPAGKPLSPPETLAAGEKYIPVPFGRPPSLLSVRAAALYVRPWPKPGEKAMPASHIPGLRANADVARQLGQVPSCEFGPWTFQRVLPTPTQPHLVGISATRSLAFALPAGDSPQVGCHANAVVVESTDLKRKVPTLIRCTLDGKCASPQSQPFRIWSEQHTRKIVAVPTEQGVLAAMSARAGERWGLYLAQSLDAGVSFELPRVIGEGTTDRGRFVLGALVALPKRTLLLISAEVTGTTRRGWYVLASDDGGKNWGPP